jgi:hypothetical protein
MKPNQLHRCRPSQKKTSKVYFYYTTPWGTAILQKMSSPKVLYRGPFCHLQLRYKVMSKSVLIVLDVNCVVIHHLGVDPENYKTKLTEKISQVQFVDEM